MGKRYWIVEHECWSLANLFEGPSARYWTQHRFKWLAQLSVILDGIPYGYPVWTRGRIVGCVRCKKEARW